MRVVHRTDDTAPGTRMEYWHQLVSDSLIPLTMTNELGGDYRGTLAQTELCGMQFTELTASPLLVRRSPRTIRRSDPGVVKIEMHTRGHSVLAQGGHECILHAGDLAVVDTSRPYRMAAGYPIPSAASSADTEVAQLVTLLVPRPMFPLGGETMAAISGLGLSARLSTGGLAATAFGQLARHVAHGDARTASRLAHVVLELIGIGAERDHDPMPALASGAYRQALVWQLRRYVEQHLGDPALSPTSLARAHHISVRYLHRLFEDESTTAAELIRSRRLDRCRRDLVDPALRDQPVAAVALRWGFTDATQFSRSFKRAYGMPPAAYRRYHLYGDGGGVTSPPELVSNPHASRPG